MDKFLISGGKQLCGEIKVEGSKNAVLPILAATVINGCENVIKNCPNLSDVDAMLDILKAIGCKVKKEGKDIIVNSRDIHTTVIPKELSKKLRASIIFTGSMLARFGEVTITQPGGCVM